MITNKLNILVVDDEHVIREGCKQILENEGHIVTLASNGFEALELFKQHTYDIAFVDFKMPQMNGLELLQRVKQFSLSTEIVIITAYGTIETAVDAMRAGAYDYVPKPFTPQAIRQVVGKIIEKSRILGSAATSTTAIEFNESGDKIIGLSPKMQEIYALIRKVAPTDSTVLISGESGTGKELIAKAIHHNSLRNAKPFMTVDCGSLVETLFESELFGHVKGSFTGAVTTKHGSFELAHKGTFFFDEISNISLSIQAKILRAIQEKEIRRVGSTDTIKVDVRVIAATNLDLRNQVEQGTFREDLFYRLSVIPVHLPPLRERRDDIMPLAMHFLEKYNQRRKRNIDSLSNEVQDRLMNYNWPGNVRELENVIERAVVIEDSHHISMTSLPSHLRDISTPQADAPFEIRTLAQLERDHIARTLEATEWNRSKTAKLLGIDRKTLYDKIKRYGINEGKAD
ncbi:sigma-54-dependent Fis family transcriptional regulator [candidate division KSB1 bacterium]|nr:sigma-54-dependent Fis family transcriptional regulator [candidate division KSB1 bacterium]